MRQIVLDTETTGLSARNGDRVVEIGCVELVDRKQTGQRLHHYLNPERDVPIDAQRIHGLTDDFLADKPKFRDIAAEFAAFIRDAELVIHNASFDMEFLNAEFGLLGVPDMVSAHSICAGVVDTLKMARDMRPGKRNTLDALCSEYGVDNSNRQFHGALLDAELLAEVYLAMTRGQESLMMELDEPPAVATSFVAGSRPVLRVVRAGADELMEHERVLQEVDAESKGRCFWRAAADPA
ncbi:MAG: DNA polymerase III subunit epsilon [Gammaproteobacteria bacterium]|nr:DNA polymerase III subunit epsilon [Gammaproteobacteria bacterium]MBU1414906.1 DNA polymerase III subunit epsilon [Gammaproteobacteria bacterium]